MSALFFEKSLSQYYDETMVNCYESIQDKMKNENKNTLILAKYAIYASVLSVIDPFFSIIVRIADVVDSVLNIAVDVFKKRFSMKSLLNRLNQIQNDCFLIVFSFILLPLSVFCICTTSTRNWANEAEKQHKEMIGFAE